MKDAPLYDADPDKKFVFVRLRDEFMKSNYSPEPEFQAVVTVLGRHKAYFLPFLKEGSEETDKHLLVRGRRFVASENTPLVRDLKQCPAVAKVWLDKLSK